jgi:ubiquinone/menaquinone biosynthesis C-methylase UbiE
VSFDRIAPYYRSLETLAFGNVLQRARTCWIGNLSHPQRTLICGEGNGRFLCELLRVHPGIEIDCVDASGEMLELARRRLLRTNPGSVTGVQFIHEDALNWLPQSSYDLLVTHFFFDCFRSSEVKSIVAKLAGAARRDAVWLIADFAVPPGGILARAHAKTWLRAMYVFFRCSANIAGSEIVDPTPYLEMNGFIRAAQKFSRAGMLKSECFVRRSCASAI